MWSVVAEESRGKRTKVWVRDPEGRRWLRKEHHESRPFEPAIEALALRLARAVGVPAPVSHVSRWIDATGYERRGLLVELFLQDDETLSLGSAELASEGDYEASVQAPASRNYCFNPRSSRRHGKSRSGQTAAPCLRNSIAC